jgi:hypothetical protein
MAGSIKWPSLVAIVLFAEVFTLAVLFGLPELRGRVYSYPHFPQLIIFTTVSRAASLIFRETSLRQRLNPPCFGSAWCLSVQE